MKSPKKVTTNDESINEAEAKLNILFPVELREMLKEKNGFDLGGFEFYNVLDKEDLQHTFDDVVRENTNNQAGWQKYLPKGYAAIATDGGQGCLVLSSKKDGKVYYWNNDMQDISVYAENGKEFEEKIRKEELDLNKPEE